MPSDHVTRMTLSAIVIVTACSNPQVSKDTPTIDQVITEAVTSTVAINREVSKIEKRLTTPTITFDEPFRINWKGPVTPLIDSLAERIKYRVEYLPKPTIHPIQVVVLGEFTTLREILDAINISTFGRAVISANADQKVLIVDYQ